MNWAKQNHNKKWKGGPMLCLANVLEQSIGCYTIQITAMDWINCFLHTLYCLVMNKAV